MNISEFFKLKPVRLVIFITIIAGIMTAVSFGIMALVKALGPKCPEGQMRINNDCFKNSCAKLDCDLGIDYSDPPNCKCRTTCPPGESPIILASGKKKCVKECGRSAEHSTNDVCTYYDPVPQSDGTVKYSKDIERFVNTKSKTADAVCFANDKSKWANGEDGLKPISCAYPNQCKVKTITKGNKKTYEPYCDHGKNEPSTQCKPNEVIGCLNTQCGNCASGTCNQITGNISGVGQCSRKAENIGVCCTPDKLTITYDHKIGCCPSGFVPINSTNNNYNSKNTPSGCCRSDNIESTSGECCNSPDEKIPGTGCCKTALQYKVGTKTLCCTGPGKITTPVYKAGKKLVSVCTNYSPDGNIPNLKATSSLSCYNGYVSYLKKNKIQNKSKKYDLESYEGIYYDIKTNTCNLACGFADDTGKIEPQNLIYKTYTGGYPKCETKGFCSFSQNNIESDVTPCDTVDNNYILIKGTDRSTAYWRPSPGSDKTSYSNYTFMVSKAINTNDSNYSKCQQETASQQATDCFDALGKQYQTEDFKISPTVANNKCTASVDGANMQVIYCSNDHKSVSGPWGGTILPYIHIAASVNGDNATQCGKVAPVWKDTNWDVTPGPNTGLISDNIATNCNSPDSCKYLQSGVYCANGSYDGSHCLTAPTTSSTTYCRVKEQNNTNNVRCKQPNDFSGAGALEASTATYYCVSDLTKSQISFSGPTCTGNGIIDQSGNYQIICKGNFTQKDQYSPCNTPITAPIIDISASMYGKNIISDAQNWPPNNMGAGNLLRSLSPFKRYDMRAGAASAMSSSSILLLGTTINIGNTPTRLYANTYTVPDKKDSSGNEVPLLALTQGNASLNLFLMAQTKNFWNTPPISSLASSSSISLCCFDPAANAPAAGTAPTYYRLLNNSYPSTSAAAADKALNGYAILNKTAQTNSDYKQSVKSIVPLIIDYGGSPPQKAPKYVLAAVCLGGEGFDQTPVIGDDSQGGNGTIFLGTAENDNGNFIIAFSEKITVALNEQLVMPDDTRAGKTITGITYTAIPQPPSGQPQVAIFDLELQDNQSVANIGQASSAQIQQIITNYHKYGTWNEPISECL